MSDCEVDPDPTNSPSCCTGSYSTAATCPSSGVPHYSYFSASFRLPCIGLLCNALSRVGVPRCIRVCIRRIERDCALDLPDVVQCRLYGHLLSLNLARTEVSLSRKKECCILCSLFVCTVVATQRGLSHHAKFRISGKLLNFFRV